MTQRRIHPLRGFAALLGVAVVSALTALPAGAGTTTTTVTPTVKAHQAGAFCNGAKAYGFTFLAFNPQNAAQFSAQSIGVLKALGQMQASAPNRAARAEVTAMLKAATPSLKAEQVAGFDPKSKAGQAVTHKVFHALASHSFTKLALFVNLYCTGKNPTPVPKH